MVTSKKQNLLLNNPKGVKTPIGLKIKKKNVQYPVKIIVRKSKKY